MYQADQPSLRRAAAEPVDELPHGFHRDIGLAVRVPIYERASRDRVGAVPFLLQIAQDGPNGRIVQNALPRDGCATPLGGGVRVRRFAPANLGFTLVVSVNALLPSVTAVTAAVAGAAWAVRGRSSSVFAPSIWRGVRSRPAIALTFDDGPSESTPALLEVLARHSIRATFFMCGVHVDRLPQVARAAAGAGHEIANHSYSHPLLCFRTSAFMRADLERAQRAIQTHTGAAPALFRAPYGVRWPGLRAAQRSLGLTGVMWTVIGYDWNLAADAIVRRIMGKVSNGAIICLHDGRELRAQPDISNTLHAVGQIIPRLLDRGYRFETVSRICQTN